VAESVDPYYLALDPGVHTGWATWYETGLLRSMGTTHSEEELHELLDAFPKTIKIVIIEDFTLWRHKAKAQAGSKMPAPKAIAQIETFARQWGSEIVKQDSDIKSTAEKWTGQSTKGVPKIQTHVMDALNHGEYYLIKNGLKEIDLREFKL
jgi:hypothetical protein